MSDGMKDEGKITCHIDGALTHSVELHIRQNYADTWTLEKYKQEFPGEPVLSEYAIATIRRRKADKEKGARSEVAEAAGGATYKRQAFHEVFELGPIKAARNPRGEMITITVQQTHEEGSSDFVPDVDPNYIFDIELTKDVLIGFEVGFPIYLWGMHGTGKTTALEQVAARTRRPFVRVQHTINTEESHILGQYVVRDGGTHFQLGPLPLAMMLGCVYCADEYDFAMPSVTAVYQPVLEGKPLIIKDAPPEYRMIRPHPKFRFCATGNTNGSGDETGLYQGTQIQNSANYSRFGITVEVKYMEPDIEASVVASQARIDKSDAAKIVDFAGRIRENYRGGKIAATISPRELITAAKFAVVRGSNWRAGLERAFIARQSRIDQEVIMQCAQRIFG